MQGKGMAEQTCIQSWKTMNIIIFSCDMIIFVQTCGHK